MPIVLPNGIILAGRGLDRSNGILFRIPPNLLALVPSIEECTRIAVGNAMRFLCDEWLVDVLTDYQGKCVLISMALSIIERLALPERPAFNISSARRGGGKTTVLHMVNMAVLGYRATAAAWSFSDEERRKVLLAYLATGTANLCWDNIPRGTLISCPAIEKALTAETYQDRILGETEVRVVPAHMIQTFTGNNIGTRSDLRSRTLDARINVTSLDPENREFAHPDPISWTEARRGKILRALFMILLGNPRLRPGGDTSQAPTRFKTWWHLVGSAVENAAKIVTEDDKGLVSDRNPQCPAEVISFKEVFHKGDEDEEQDNSLEAVLRVIRAQWPNGTDAATVARFINDKIRDPQSMYDWISNPEGADLKDAIETAAGKIIKNATASIITWRLKAIVDAPAEVNGELLTLKYLADHHGGTFAVRPVR